MKKILPSLLMSSLAAGWWSSAALAQSTAASAWFRHDPEWTATDSVTLAPDGQSLSGATAENGRILLFAGTGQNKAQLHTHGYLSDVVVHFDFMIDQSSDAEVYLEGKYGLKLAANGMGDLGAMREPKPNIPQDGVVAAKVNASGKPGTWQTFEAKFRAPRFDDARNKTQEALLLEVKINGQTVQTNTIAYGITAGTDTPWEDAGGSFSFAVEHGSLAIQNFSIQRADFDAVKVPAASGQATNIDKLVDLVEQGRDNFRNFGCIECHATQEGDVSTKAGPDLFGLFRVDPRERVVLAGEGHHFTIKANRSYLERSVRTPQQEIAIGESGPKKDQAYPPVMPTFAPSVLSDRQIDAIYAYLGTLNPPEAQGPITYLASEAELKNYDPVADRLQLLVDNNVRIQRGPMEHVSARAIHVGQPNGVNFTFDPRLLSFAQIWQGGFLDMTGEFTGRGGAGLKKGYDSREIDLGKLPYIFAPLNAKGELVDFSFKDAIFKDGATIRESLYSKQDHLDRLAAIDAQFLGYSRDSSKPNAAPVFKYRVGKNVVEVQANIDADGKIRLVVKGKLSSPQTFALNEFALGKTSVTAGEIKDGHWVVPASLRGEAVAEGHLTFAPNTWRPKATTFNYAHQPLVVEPSYPKIPPGYRAERYMGPKDNYGRDMLFEPLGMAVAPDGTLVVATRTAGIWRLSNGQWNLFAQGLFDSLGVQVEDKHGLKVVAGQKPELTRITDTTGDGIADSYETMTDAFSYHGNYHSYMHGPVRAPDGSYFITLNLDDGSGANWEYNANGKYMGTSGGFRGWAVHVPAKGGFEPFANGLRSPAGIGFGPDGKLYYLDNQGEYNGTSELYELKKGKFYGHPAGLVDLPGMTPDSPEIQWNAVASRRENPIALFPENRLANSPGNPVWQLPADKFGPFAGQMFVGDQTQSNLMRVSTEKVGDHVQGSIINFAVDLESGPMRPIFLPDHSLLIGEVGRGWQSKGGHIASLQRIIWDGKTIPPAIHHVSAAPGGFDLVFTLPIPAAIADADFLKDLKIQSWVYRNAPDYGSPELDDHAEDIKGASIGKDRKTVRVTLVKTEQPVLQANQTPRVYRITVDGKPIFGDNIGPGFEAFYTLYEFPGAKK
jgi:mono/diheme cytochrome c family protein